MTADQREQALAAAFDRVSDPEYGERLEWNTGGARTYTAVEREADLAIVRAALTPPPLPENVSVVYAWRCPTCGEHAQDWDDNAGDAAQHLYEHEDERHG